jgi:hypothetical protein
MRISAAFLWALEQGKGYWPSYELWITPDSVHSWIIQMTNKYSLKQENGRIKYWERVKADTFGLREPKDKHLQTIDGGWSSQNSISFSDSALSIFPSKQISPIVSPYEGSAYWGTAAVSPFSYA